jgi:hypothetical protein
MHFCLDADAARLAVWNTKHTPVMSVMRHELLLPPL